MSFRLVKPSIEYQDSFIEMAREFQAQGESCYASLLSQKELDFRSYVLHLEMDEKGIDIPPGQVPQFIFWSVEKNELIGSIFIRHGLTPELGKNGKGHIEYNIRPSKRRQGYGTRQLGLALKYPEEWDWVKVLITCHIDDIASIKIIETNGGKIWDTIQPSKAAAPVRRYWIHMPGKHDGFG